MLPGFFRILNAGAAHMITPANNAAIPARSGPFPAPSSHIKTTTGKSAINDSLSSSMAIV